MIISVSAQEQFIAKGKIEFERTMNLHKQIDMSDSWGEMMKKSTPQNKVDYFDLYFSENKTLYKPGREIVNAPKVSPWMLGPAFDNTVFNDLNEQKFSSQKTIFEATYIIQDSLRKINWKITPDTRTIAGFECRKATAIIMDTVYVVAFYTDQILTTGGPESFTGLPGMILGLAIPRLNVTWFATKLELVQVKETELVSPKKGKKTTNADLLKQLADVMKNWGKEGQRNVLKVML